LSHSKNAQGEGRTVDGMKTRLMRAGFLAPPAAYLLHRYLLPPTETGYSAASYPLAFGDKPLERTRYLTNTDCGAIPPPESSTERKVLRLRKTELTLDELWDVVPMGDLVSIDLYGGNLNTTVILRRKVPEHVGILNKITRPTIVQIIHNVNRIDFLVTYKRILERANEHNFDIPTVIPRNVAKQKADTLRRFIPSESVVENLSKVGAGFSSFGTHIAGDTIKMAYSLSVFLGIMWLC